MSFFYRGPGNNGQSGELEWRPATGDISLSSRNGVQDGELKQLVKIVPFDEDGLAACVNVLIPDSVVIRYGRGFMKESRETTVVSRSDFFVENLVTGRIDLFIYLPPKHKLLKAERVSGNGQKVDHNMTPDPIVFTE